MAERPIFVSVLDSDELVKEIFFQIHWHSGFARTQKEKNVEELHEAAASNGYRNLLEGSYPKSVISVREGVAASRSSDRSLR
jgi:hypothetical protein